MDEVARVDGETLDIDAVPRDDPGPADPGPPDPGPAVRGLVGRLLPAIACAPLVACVLLPRR